VKVTIDPEFWLALLNGLEAARQIEHILPSTPMLLFTMYLTPGIVAEAQQAGFGAAISKNMSANLVGGLEVLLRRGPFYAVCSN